jgi:hypothetical protein
MFDLSDQFRADLFARYHATMRASEESATRLHAERQTKAQRQQRIQDAAAKRAALARPDPRYKPNFPN